MRVSLNASAGSAKVRVQIDVGFGDAITPGAVEVDFPVVLEAFPKLHLRTYPREAGAATKGMGGGWRSRTGRLASWCRCPQQMSAFQNQPRREAADAVG